MSTAPLSFKELSHTVEDYLTKHDNLRGWSIDALQDTEPKRINFFPFASQAGTGVHLCFTDEKEQWNVRFSLSNFFTSLTQFLPVVKYSAKVDNVSHKVWFDSSTGSVKYDLEHEVFVASLKSCLSDGGAGIYAISGRIATNAHAGIEVQYDPLRSGLKDLSVVAAQKSCPNFNQGDILAKYSLLSGLGIHLRVPVNKSLDVSVISENNRFILGCQTRTHCGTTLTLNTNVIDCTGTLTAVRNLKDMWKMTTTCTVPLLSCSPSVPKFGLRFTNQDKEA